MYSQSDKKRGRDSEASSTQEFSSNKALLLRSYTPFIAVSASAKAEVSNFTPSPFSMFQPLEQAKTNGARPSNIFKPVAQKSIF